MATRLYTFFTPAHEVFLTEWFLPTLQDDYVLCIERIDPDGKMEEARYGTSPFNDLMRSKTDLIIRAIRENWGRAFVYSDCDVQFFQPTAPLIPEFLADQDFICQRNTVRGGLCPGFFFCTGNEETLDLWLRIKAIIERHHEVDDQDVLNLILRTDETKKLLSDRAALAEINVGPAMNVRYGLLPDPFYCYGQRHDGLWEPGKALGLPPAIVLHHANWTVGVSSKLTMLTEVRQCARTGTA